jgi:hypothetical protein
MKVHGLTEYKLTDLDWELLDALYAVLAVSFYPNSDSSAVRSTRCTGSSYGSANHVGRIDASALRSCSVFRNLHDPMGKTPFQVPRVETLGPVVVHTLVHLGTVLLGLLSVMQHR